MAMPSANPTITIARPNNSGRSLSAASAAAPVYATAIAAPIDDPATAIAAPSNAAQLLLALPGPAAAAVSATAGPAVNACTSTTSAATATTALTAQNSRTASRPRRRKSIKLTANPVISAGEAITQVNMPPPFRPPGPSRAGTADPHR